MGTLYCFPNESSAFSDISKSNDRALKKKTKNKQQNCANLCISDQVDQKSSKEQKTVSFSFSALVGRWTWEIGRSEKKVKYAR